MEPSYRGFRSHQTLSSQQQHPVSAEPSSTLCARSVRFLFGILLVAPIINIIIHIAYRYFIQKGTIHEQQKAVKSLAVHPSREEPQQELLISSRSEEGSDIYRKRDLEVRAMEKFFSSFELVDCERESDVLSEKSEEGQGTIKESGVSQNSEKAKIKQFHLRICSFLRDCLKARSNLPIPMELREFVEKNRDLINRGDDCRIVQSVHSWEKPHYTFRTSLVHAAECNHFDLVKLLANNGADNDRPFPTDSDHSPLCYALKGGYYKTARFILENCLKTCHSASCDGSCIEIPRRLWKIFYELPEDGKERLLSEVILLVPHWRNAFVQLAVEHGNTDMVQLLIKKTNLPLAMLCETLDPYYRGAVDLWYQTVTGENSVF